MWMIKSESIKPIKKWHVVNNEYIIIVEYVEEDKIKGKVLSNTKTVQRFCKAKKNGDIIINFNGQKIKANINQIED